MAPHDIAIFVFIVILFITFVIMKRVNIHKCSKLVNGIVVKEESANIEGSSLGIPGPFIVVSIIEYFDEEDYKYYRFSSHKHLDEGTEVFVRLYKLGIKRVHYLDEKLISRISTPLYLLILSTLFLAFMILLPYIA